MSSGNGRSLALALALGLLFCQVALAQGKNLAPGFTHLPKDAKVVVAPIDLELFEVSGGGVPEPKADWTDAALRHMKLALANKTVKIGLSSGDMDTKTAEEQAELLNLTAAVSRAIAGNRTLPTKEGKLDWSFGDSLVPLQQATGSRYALFTWLRDSYASAERKAMMGVVAVLSAVATAGANVVILGGGIQSGYASLVDLETGQVLWFNQLISGSGDMRTEPEAAKTVDALLREFPVGK
jgi:hypothetical protein